MLAVGGHILDDLDPRFVRMTASLTALRGAWEKASKTCVGPSAPG